MAVFVIAETYLGLLQTHVTEPFEKIGKRLLKSPYGCLTGSKIQGTSRIDSMEKVGLYHFFIKKAAD